MVLRWAKFVLSFDFVDLFVSLCRKKWLPLWNVWKASDIKMHFDFNLQKDAF